jgi:hypothetical protein
MRNDCQGEEILLSPKRNNSKSQMAVVEFTGGYHFWVGITTSVLKKEYSFAIQISKSKGRNQLHGRFRFDP